VKPIKFIAALLMAVGLLGPGSVPAASQDTSQTGTSWPDENGYAGPIDHDPTSDPATTEPLFVDQDDWSFLNLDGEPDQDQESRSPEWSTFYYIFAAGSTMRPRDSSTTWTYPGVGCISVGRGNDFFTLHVDLPEGSKVDYLRIFYYDTSATDSQGAFTMYDGAGGFTDLTSAFSTGEAGYGTALSPLLEHIVGNVDNSYVLLWRANDLGTDTRLCGLRLAYRLPD